MTSQVQQLTTHQGRTLNKVALLGILLSMGLALVKLLVGTRIFGQDLGTVTATVIPVAVAIGAVPGSLLALREVPGTDHLGAPVLDMVLAQVGLSLVAFLTGRKLLLQSLLFLLAQIIGVVAALVWRRKSSNTPLKLRIVQISLLMVLGIGGYFLSLLLRVLLGAVDFSQSEGLLGIGFFIVGAIGCQDFNQKQMKES